MAIYNILAVDDEEFIRMNLKNIFSGESYKLYLAENGRQAREIVKKEQIDLALLDLNLPDTNGIKVLKELKVMQPDLLVIIITGYASVESAVEALKLGAYDYMRKPFKADAIKLIVRLALETQSLKERVKELKDSQSNAGARTMLGESDAIHKVKHQIEEFAKHDSETVLVTGESGSGKELAALALHELSRRRSNEFIEINCASIPESLLESELFGYEKGAFTDAKQRKKGLFEKANGGTLFLDEIGEMSAGLQAKLLRVLENKKFRRLGGTQDIQVDLRIVAATNRDLQDAIREKQFREDLYYRLNVLRVEMPPLRERGQDILILARHFLELFNKKFNKKIEGFSKEASGQLMMYSWPGNIRELKNVVERICILQKGSMVSVENLPGEILNPSAAMMPDSPDKNLGQMPLDEIMFNVELELIKKARTIANYNVSQTARLLKIPRETLRYKLSKMGFNDGEN